MSLKELGEAFAHRDLPYASNTAHAGSLPLESRLFQVQGDVVVSGVKTAEDGESLVIRLANAHTDRPAEAALTFGFPVSQVCLADLAEQPIEETKLQEGKVQLEARPGQVLTVIAK